MSSTLLYFENQLPSYNINDVTAVDSFPKKSHSQGSHLSSPKKAFKAPVNLRLVTADRSRLIPKSYLYTPRMPGGKMNLFQPKKVSFSPKVDIFNGNGKEFKLLNSSIDDNIFIKQLTIKPKNKKSNYNKNKANLVGKRISNEVQNPRNCEARSQMEERIEYMLIKSGMKKSSRNVYRLNDNELIHLYKKLLSLTTKKNTNNKKLNTYLTI